MYIKRHLENKILEASGFYPVVMVCGQRQVGKSTMMHHIMEENRKYVTLDDINARRLAENDPALFFETYGYPLLIDEFQRVPSILLEMKRIVDEKALNNEDNCGMYWLTGSQKFQMMKNVSESLAGRIAVFELSSLSSGEIDGKPYAPFNPDIEALNERKSSIIPKNVHAVFQNIFRGGMPRLQIKGIDREHYYMDYINTYIERDIKGLSQVGKLSHFHDFLIFMAAHTSMELHYEEIANSIGISAPTAKEWVTILERSGIIYLLRPYYSNISKRLVKTPKTYFMDTGLAAYLCRWTCAETLENGAMSGAFFETYVITEILKSFYNAGKPADMYYYRDIDKKEIDLLIIRENKIYPVEIKKSKAPASPDKNFSVLTKFNMEVQPGIIICMSDELIPYNKNTWLCPVSII